MSLKTPPQNIPDSPEEDEEEQFTRKDLKFNDSVTVEVKWPVSEEVVSLIIILSDAPKTEISAFRIDLSADEDLNFPDSLSIITIYGLDPKNKVLFSSVKNEVDSGTKTVALEKHKPDSSFTNIFRENMKKSFIEQGHDGSVVFNPPIPFDCEETLISVKTSSQIGSTPNYSEYMFYQTGTFQIHQLLPSREFVKYTIYPMNKTECFEHEFITRYNTVSTDMSLETKPQNIPDSSEEDEEEQFTMKDLKFNDSVTVEVKWPVSEEVVSLIIILSDAPKTEISAFRIDLSAEEDLNFPDSLSRITIYGIDPENKVLLSSVKKEVVSGTKTVALEKHKPDSSFTNIFRENMKKSFIEQGHDGSVVFNPPIPFDCEETLISVKTSSQIGSTLNYSEYMFYQTGTFQIRQLLPSREFVKYTIYQMNKTECFEHEFITHNSQEDVAALLKMANDFSDSTLRDEEEIEVRKLYRDQPETRSTGIFATYIKDNNGDQASSINNQINGIFFYASPDYNTSEPLKKSYFGKYRIKIPPGELISEMNMYFADFYCYKEAHYVTLVVTKPGSREDKYCSPRLVKLDNKENRFPKSVMVVTKPGSDEDDYCSPRLVKLDDTKNRFLKSVTLVVTKPGSDEDDYCSPRLVRLDDTENRFLMFRPSHGEYFTRQDKIWVEVLYTENIDLKLMKTKGKLEEEIIDDVHPKGKDLYKNRSCKKCNLPKTAKSLF